MIVYINKQKALEIIYFECGEWRGLAKTIEKDLDDLPPEAVKPAKPGHWYKPTGMMPPEYTGVYRCSICDCIAMRDWKRMRQVLTRFCPGCGAFMTNGEGE